MCTKISLSTTQGLDRIIEALLQDCLAGVIQFKLTYYKQKDLVNYSYHQNIDSDHLSCPTTCLQGKPILSVSDQFSNMDKIFLFAIQITEDPSVCLFDNKMITLTVNIREEVQHGMKGISQKLYTSDDAYKLRRDNQNQQHFSHLADVISVCINLSSPCVCLCTTIHFNGTFLLSKW